MMRRSALVSLLLAAGCAQPPTDELAITASRIEAARQQDAPVFAPELFAEAERSFAEANRLAELQGDYLAAIQAAAHSTLRANEAFFRASSERSVAVRKLDRLLFELGSLLEIAGYRGARVGAADDLARFQARYDAIRAMVQERDLLDALAAASALKPELLAFEERFRRE
ncbi:MAG TPA: hypothetical protein VIE88_14840 [Vicinamibacteria bacterium]|jgi:hypothetical protein